MNNNVTSTRNGDFVVNPIYVPRETDNVNHPSHYTKGKIEVIDMMLKVFGKEVVINYCDLNAFKYRMRAGYKNDIVEDINKALWYEKKSKELSQTAEV